MVHCSVIGCKSRSERKEENITFHSYPKDPDVRKSWILSTGRSKWEPKKYDRICSRHFVENCFRKTLLKVYLNPFSVPTLNVHNPTLCDNKSTVHHQEEISVATTSDMLGESTNFSKIIEMDCEINSHKDTFPISPSSETFTPRKKKMAKKLKLQTLLANQRKKKLAVLRSRNRRLQKKNAELSDIIQKLQSKFLINQETSVARRLHFLHFS